MGIFVKTTQTANNSYWDNYVYNHPYSNLYHLYQWQNIIKKTYGHQAYYLSAVDNPHNFYPIRGILPLIHLKHFIFDNSLISMPFFDMGGIIADNEKIENALIDEAIKLGQKLKVNSIELRHTKPVSYISDNLHIQKLSHKVQMLLKLPNSSEALMKSFKSKLRSQIKRPMKAGLYAKIGKHELLNDFYKVFTINMRDLGSPVHSKSFMKNILNDFPGKAKIVIIYKEKQPIACSFIISFNKNTLANTWASSLRKYSRLSPNMLLYWTMLKYGCDNGYTCFDFGRSTPNEGTYKFKKQWGAEPVILNWQYISLISQTDVQGASNKSKFDKAINYWKKLPVFITKIIGPPIRKNIGL